MKYMTNSTKQAIGFDYILKNIEVLTPYGRDKKSEMEPFFDKEKLNSELNKVSIIKDSIEDNRNLYEQLTSLFIHIKDIRNSIYRAKNDSILSVVELYEIKTFISIIEDIEAIMHKLPFDMFDDTFIESSDTLRLLFDPEDKGLQTFYIYEEYSEELKRIRAEKRNIGKEIKLEKNKKRKELKDKFNIRIDPKGEVVVSKENGELNDELNNSDEFEYLSESYMSIRYKIKDSIEISNLINKLESLKYEEEEEEIRIREKISSEIGFHFDFLMNNIESIGNFDLKLAKAYLALRLNATEPKILDENEINIIEGIHPKAKQEVTRRNGEFIPISIYLNKGVTCITGANMGGKTITLRIIALLTAMAQYGLLVPAKSMETSLREYIFVSMGDLQSIDSGLSTFGGEINKVKNALSNSDKKGLILIDELARGTNPKEGYAISKSILKYLLEKPSINVITTHYDNIANTKGVVHYQVIGLKNLDFNKLKNESKDIGIEAISQFMDYRLTKLENIANVPRDALNISKFMGLQDEILDQAEKILMEGED
ncbi:MutS-related protein [Senegalia massiliensis]|uniref:DNA mismatch repair protein MutS n=1 Tax=Senegalia massiliensis TaxID=1720316 RepID=A0A845QXK1_9CLOT|nr:DNA mismatch repair protein MutS [Senegalia massiliensis]NBI06226.1 DNA mismatch repair protein MutS [Senegalia massiliensis]